MERQLQIWFCLQLGKGAVLALEALQCLLFYDLFGKVGITEFWQGSCAICTGIWDALASRMCVCYMVHKTNPAMDFILHVRTAGLRFGEDVQ